MPEKWWKKVIASDELMTKIPHSKTHLEFCAPVMADAPAIALFAS
ncbi:hypothetical protein [Escherichia coli ISC7]|uniref:Uncharacterized protein n=1 Tax=Escherichia coli ISC7 TaxID=1432555 RepID=W1F670_ECOLX|nr:hypothetical protein [Escherichia coli ISC7]